MLILGSVGFAAPWLLLALPALPALWWLLRVTPPSPRRVAFPALRLLRDLPAPEETPSRTPPWLLALRLLAAALLVVGLARPVLDPVAAGPATAATLLLVVDDGWAGVADWPARQAAAAAALERAERAGRRAALLATAPSASGTAEPVATLPAGDLRPRLAALRPKPWPPDRAAASAALVAWRAGHPEPAEVLYLADGVEHGPAGRAEFAPLAAALAALGPLTVATPPGRSPLLAPPVAEGEGLRVRVLAAPSPVAWEAGVLARTGDGAALARLAVPVASGAAAGEAVLELPRALRDRVERLDLEGEAGAGGTVLLDERYRRRPVGLLAGGGGAEAGAALTGPLYYLERALSPFTEIRRAAAPAALLARPLSLLVLADRPLPAGPEREAVAAWVEAGGTLLRFAGPLLAAAPDPLLPLPLRAGERQLGGALSWERPQALAPFPADSPFAGLAVPADVAIQRQVLAEPGPAPGTATWARLADGTPLVTAAPRGAGRVVLVHVTANAAWSDLPLSGLFVEMLRRVVALSAGVGPGAGEGEAPLSALRSLDGQGRLGAPPPAAAPLAAVALDAAAPSPRHPPGWWAPAGAGTEAPFRRALNLGAALPPPRALPPPPPGATLVTVGPVAAEREAGPWLLAAALALLALDLLLSLRLRGLLRLPAAGAAAGLLLLAPLGVAAQPAEPPLATRLAFVETGEPALDLLVRQGLEGLSAYVNARTAAALAAPAAVRPGADDLSVYPLLYWAVTSDAEAPDAAAAAALDAFMASGGIILFDTRDAGSGEGMAPGAGAALRRVTAPLAIPPLAPVAEDHVLRRAFYLLPELPGRFAGGEVWAARDEDRANDSVSPVVVGGHDWAGAWAVDARGASPLAAVPGGARQRTQAYRFGVNLVMYALTGNYKGDQVHVPAILERLGN